MKSTAEQIVEPMEIVWDKLVKLANESKSSNLNPEYTKNQVFTIAQEMDAALSFLRRDVEGILEPELPPDDFYENYRSEEDLVEYAPAPNQEPSIWESFKSHLDAGENYKIIKSGQKQLVKYGSPASEDLFENYASEEDLSDIVDMTTHRGEEK